MFPDLSHVQFYLLALLLHGGEMSGYDLRKKLAKEGYKKTLAAFYTMCNRAEDDGLIEGWHEVHVEDGQTVREKKYRISGAGERAWRKQQRFYEESSGLGLAGAGGA